MMSGKPLKSFWITNVSKRDVSLADLNVTIRSFTSVNLLDSKHYQLTESQIQNSLNGGSLAKKSDKIKLRLAPPPSNKATSILKQETALPSRARSGIPTIVPQYDELDVSDDAIAEELAETAEQDRQPRHSRNS